MQSSCIEVLYINIVTKNDWNKIILCIKPVKSSANKSYHDVYLSFWAGDPIEL